jgi:hypothetical protein
MAATLYMKTEKKGPWTPHYFKLFQEDLVYYPDANSEERLGAVSLKEPDTTVTLLKPEAAEGGDKLFPIKVFPVFFVVVFKLTHLFENNSSSLLLDNNFTFQR